MSKTLTFKISVPTDGSFLGRECNNPECKKYFKIHQESLKDEMYCPYCGLLFKKEELSTQDQLNYVQKVGIEKVTAHVHEEVSKIFGSAFGRHNQSRKSGVSISYKPASPYKEKSIAPPAEKEVDTKLECPKCSANFQVYGIFGYCPSCKEENMMIYDTNISILLSEIEKASNKNKALRHAYNDLVSTFEDFCKKKNATKKNYKFQNLDSVEELFKDIFAVDLFEGLDPDKVTLIRRFFQKRHVYQHNKGIIDQKYVDLIPEDKDLLGEAALLDLQEFKDAAVIIRKMLSKII